MRYLGFIFILLFACKAKKEVAPVYETTTEPQEEPKVIEATAPPTEAATRMISEEDFQEEQRYQQKLRMMQEMGVDHPSWADSIIIALERTSCFGSCPSYRFTISKNGYASYKGLAFVEREGEYIARVDQALIDKIRNEAKRILYVDFREYYWEPITDVPQTYSSIVLNNKRKNVLNQSEAPQSLNDFENFIDSVIEEIDWKQQAK